MPARLDLIQRPTPLHRLSRMSDRLGIDLWIKRDDLTGFALGGNKGRKLEYLLADAQAKGATAIVTCGAAQSNFLRHLATGCAMLGLKCAAAIMPLPYEDEPADGGLVPEGASRLIMETMGMDLRLLPNGNWDTLIEASAALASEYTARGETVYPLAIGGSSPLGALAFYEAAHEIQGQEAGGGFDQIVHASSSGSTQTGLTYAFHETSTRVKGVACDPEPELVEEFVDLGAGLDAILGRSVGLTRADFDYDLRFVGPGYGVASEESLAAVRTLGRAEGILLDPIYTGKAFAGLLALVESGEIEGRVLFWHTGGTPALFCLPEPDRLSGRV